MAFVGDGGSNQGTFLESLNLSSVWNLPCVFVVENNGYAEATPAAYHLGGPDVAGVGLQGEPTDAVGVLQHRLPDHPHGQAGEPVGHGSGLLGHLAQRLLPVEVLAAGDEPHLVGVERGGERGSGHERSSGVVRGSVASDAVARRRD